MNKETAPGKSRPKTEIGQVRKVLGTLIAWSNDLGQNNQKALLDELYAKLPEEPATAKPPVTSKGLWAPINIAGGREYVIWPCLASSKQRAKEAYFKDIPMNQRWRALSRVRFARVQITEVTKP